jgi:hypothetical protein
MKKNIRKFVVIVCVILGCCLLIGGICFWSWNKINYYTTLLNVSKEQFLKTITLVHLEDVEKTLGITADHQFTIADNSHEYVLLSCSLDKNNSTVYWFLFEDGVLKTINHAIYYKEYPKIWDIEENTRIQGVLHAAGLSQKEIVEEINSPLEIQGEEPWNILPAVILTSGLLVFELPVLAHDYERNYMYKKQYNGLQAHLGMSPEQIDKLFGRPMRSYLTKDKECVRIYGENVSLRVSRFLEFSCIAAVFRDGKLVKVLSNSFFNPNWKNESDIDRR